jgi:hypothetical protein
MPVLDAKALKTDPEGAAFLLSVLRRSPAPVTKTMPRPNAMQARPGKAAEGPISADPSTVSV